MKYSALILIIYFICIFTACNDDTIVNNHSGPTETYQKVISLQEGNTKFEVWSVDNDSLMTGYNKIGFKVFENDIAKTSGYVKFSAKMFHFNSNEFHSTPVEPLYNYNPSLGMFTGYIIMLMPSDTTSRWYGYYNYNDAFTIDSANFAVGWDKLTKFKIFVHLQTDKRYLITLLSPKYPVVGINDFWCLLHESPDFNDFTQLNTAQMYLKPKLDSLNHVSAGNTNPVYSGDGIYKGKVNFDYSGNWKLYDSIYYNNIWITENETPYMSFIVP